MPENFVEKILVMAAEELETPNLPLVHGDIWPGN
jgi:hypothetical protein